MREMTEAENDENNFLNKKNRIEKVEKRKKAMTVTGKSVFLLEEIKKEKAKKILKKKDGKK
jgi:hypothetical protein